MGNDEKKKMIIVDIMIEWFSQHKVMINAKKFLKHEYKNYIGTSYKRSEKESNGFLRFKERFKRQYQLAYVCAIESMGR